MSETAKPTPQEVIETSAAIANEAAKAGKAFYKSKTFWTNTLLAGGVFFSYVPPVAAVYVGTGVNILLRFLTKKPVVISEK